jgi:glutaredoxin-related protein
VKEQRFVSSWSLRVLEEPMRTDFGSLVKQTKLTLFLKGATTRPVCQNGWTHTNALRMPLFANSYQRFNPGQ